ncbi:MAG: hypothetical protein HC936_03100 [Leptolyngbyaceae cyanobacterium SU_3_3]|nr:hypothetical protein [Leptolyngbyaceae cyanobacterium SU_3_3]
MIRAQILTVFSIIQLAIPNQPVLVVDLFKLQQLSRLKSLLQSSVLKIGHHLKFDWQFLTQAGLQPQSPFSTRNSHSKFGQQAFLSNRHCKPSSKSC